MIRVALMFSWSAVRLLYFYDSIRVHEGLDITDTFLRANTALMLENAKHWMAHICRGRIDESGNLHINEATRSVLLGGFSDYIFPVIRAAFPTNPINDLISVQPTTRRTSTIVYWNWIYGTNKGGIAKGQRMFDAQTGVPFTAGGWRSRQASYQFRSDGLTRGGSVIVDAQYRP